MDSELYNTSLISDVRVTRAVDASGRPMATRLNRVFALMMDWFVVGLIAGVMDFVLFAWTRGSSLEISHFGVLLAIRLTVDCIVSFAAYFFLNRAPLSESGQTLGMRWRAVRFVRKDGRSVGPSRILWRRTAFLWPIYFVPGLNALFALFSFGLALRKSRYSLHDDIADTAVVNVMEETAE